MKAVDQRHYFLFLQFADVLTTLFAFSIGLGEANPVLRWFFPIFGPVMGLVVGKLLTVMVMMAFMMTRKTPNWNFVNKCFLVVVGWNITIIGFTILGA